VSKEEIEQLEAKLAEMDKNDPERYKLSVRLQLERLRLEGKDDDDTEASG